MAGAGVSDGADISDGSGLAGDGVPGTSAPTPLMLGGVGVGGAVGFVGAGLAQAASANSARVSAATRMGLRAAGTLKGSSRGVAARRATVRLAAAHHV
jgi:hypothetical protein